MVTNASVGVGARGEISKIIAVNPAANKNKLHPIELITPLNKALAEHFATEEEVIVQVILTTRHQHVELVYNRTKVCFQKSFTACNFNLRHQQIIMYTAQGYDVKQLAAKLKLSIAMITAYRQEIYDILESDYNMPRRTHSIKWYAGEVGLG